MRRALPLVACFLLYVHSTLLLAVTTAGASSTIVVPVVASTGSFVSEIAVYYPGPFSGTATSMTINVFYYDANGLPSPGLKPCAQLSINAGETKSFVLASQCTLGAGGHFGVLVLQDAAAEKTNYFFAFNRTESIGAHEGFSVEGFPIGNFSGQGADASGLKRIAAPPGFQTNCFVAALGEAVDYQVLLFDSSGTQIGSTLTGTLGAWQEVRYVDIFTTVGAPAGDYTNARATFVVTDNPNRTSLIGFCTVQENQSFGADFRIAKSREGRDNGQRRVFCRGGNADCTDIQTGFQITDVTKKDGYRLLIRPPDFVKCTILGSQASSLEIALLPIGTFAPGGTVLAGGTGQRSFYYSTGPRSTSNGGVAEFFNLEVETIAAAPAGTYTYAIRCDSGNGTGDSGRVNTGNSRGF